MKKPDVTDWETTLDLPLGTIGEHIRRVETELRAVDIVAAGTPGGGLPEVAARAVAARLEAIRTTLDVIEGLILDVEAHLAPRQQLRNESDDHGEHRRRSHFQHYDD